MALRPDPDARAVDDIASRLVDTKARLDDARAMLRAYQNTRCEACSRLIHPDATECCGCTLDRLRAARRD